MRLYPLKLRTKHQHFILSPITLIFIVLFATFFGSVFGHICFNEHLACAYTPGDKVTAKFIDHLAVNTFTIMDKDDSPRAQMGVDNNGTMVISVMDKNQNDRMTISFGDGCSFVRLVGKNGNSRLILGAKDDGYVGISMYDNNKKPIACLTSGDKGRPYLALMDENGSARHILSIKDSGPVYLMTDQRGEGGNLFYINDSGTSGLSIGMSKKSDTLAFIGMYDGAPVMTLKDRHNAKVFAGFGKNTGGMISVQEHGQEIWHAGVQGQAPAPEIDVTDLLK